MKTYKVISLSVGGLNNKIYKSGDVVREDSFAEKRAEQLVLGGFLEAIETKSKAISEDEKVEDFDKPKFINNKKRKK